MLPSQRRNFDNELQMILDEVDEMIKKVEVETDVEKTRALVESNCILVKDFLQEWFLQWR